MNKYTHQSRRGRILSCRLNHIQLTYLLISLLTITWACSGSGNKSPTKANAAENNYSNASESDNETVASNNNNSNNPSNGTGAVNSTGKRDTVSRNDDADFILRAAEISLAEIKLGQLAQQRGTGSEVKQLGKIMVAEHTKAMKALMALAKTNTVTLPTEPGSKTMDTYNILKAKSGKAFDRAYSDMMVTGHNDAILLFEQTAASANDEKIKAWAAQMLPALRLHRQQTITSQKESNKM